MRNAPDYSFSTDIDYNLLSDQASVDLIKELYRFPAVVKSASETYEPHIVARFSIAVAQAFNKFYHDNKVLVDDKDLMNARLSLVYLTRKVINDSMDLLGIECVEQM